ncbi:hypothetical protein R1flu_014924 [Riccia fluitans]|uniref:Uncharacterized protein n=1 Tax=Riccia fluitans TaxID=41844 RepID=A0ABD1YHR8_9MARC
MGSISWAQCQGREAGVLELVRLFDCEFDSSTVKFDSSTLLSSARCDSRQTLSGRASGELYDSQVIFRVLVIVTCFIRLLLVVCVSVDLQFLCVGN